MENEPPSGSAGNSDNQGDRDAVVHASCVALGNCAVLIQGASGSGKSALALQLLAFGASLVSDDRTGLKRVDDAVLATAPEAISGMIEARGVGLLAVEPVATAHVCLVVDMNKCENMRLPPQRSVDILGVSLPLAYRVDDVCFPAAIFQLLKGGRRA